ncbi:MAG: NrsF family protein [Aestuariivirga sp.]|nr:NrsF family protein [Aestuariivirga sp.]
MNTSELIKKLAADTRRTSIPLPAMWWGAVVIAVFFAAGVFFAILGPRPDIAAAAATARFLFKFLFATALAASAFGCAAALSRPGANWHNAALGISAAPTLLAMAVIAELFALSPAAWLAAMIGRNGLVCMTYIPLIGLGPLAIFLWILHRSAPTRPAVAGSVAGLLAGGIGAFAYAAHCNDDSPLFVATWYSLAIAGLVALGAAGASRFARW